jgi:ribosome biogenesis GTPase A
VGQQTSVKPVFPPEIAPYIDVGAYLLDSRAPAATFYLDRLLLGKELIILTRSDQADAGTTSRWKKFFKAGGYPCLTVDSVSGSGLDSVLDFLARLLQQKIRLANRRGIQTATLRLAALGVPNVGKSTFLNQLIGRRRFKTGNRPGITRGQQWVRLFEDVEVLDTPGILRDPVGLNRRKPYWMLLNLMPYDYRLREKTVELLIAKLGERGLDRLKKYYKRAKMPEGPLDWLGLLDQVGHGRGFRTDNDDGVDRAARTLFKDFQDCRFGRISLEEPELAQITSPFFPRETRA